MNYKIHSFNFTFQSKEPGQAWSMFKCFETKYVQSSAKIVKQIRFNPFLGALLFIALELPSEELRRETKLAKNQDVEDAIRYLKTIFWVYANSERFNFTEDQFKQQVFVLFIYTSLFIFWLSFCLCPLCEIQYYIVFWICVSGERRFE